MRYRELRETADMNRLQHYIDLAKAAPTFADFERAISTAVSGQVYRAPDLAAAIQLRQDSGSLAGYDAPARAEWFGHGTVYATPVPANGMVTIYRATVTGQAIRPGDYVTQSRRYAQVHRASNLGGSGTIAALTVTLDDLFPADGPNEFWYAPHELAAFRSVEDFYQKMH